MNRFKFSMIALVVALAVAMPAVFSTKTVHAGTIVDLELQLLVDVSGSVVGTEFNLQRQGYVDAFNNLAVINAISDGAIGSIAVQYIYWSGAGQQSIGVDWTKIDDQASSQAFAASVLAANRPFIGQTAVGSAIGFGDPLFDNNGFDGTRQVIDVSGDGGQNDGISTIGARDAFIAGGGDAINGIVIGGSASVFNFYVNNVQAGVGSFTLTANSFDDFGAAIQDKLIKEIKNPPVPEPATVALLGIGLVGLAGTEVRRRRKKKAVDNS